MEAVFLETNRYQPFSYRKKVSGENGPINACYIGIIVPLPIDYHVQRKLKFIPAQESATKKASILIELFVIPTPRNGHDKTKDFLWKDQFIIDGKEISADLKVEDIDIAITVRTIAHFPEIAYSSVQDERNIEYINLKSLDWDVGHITIRDNDPSETNSENSTIATINEPTDISRSLVGESDDENPPAVIESKELGSGTPTKGTTPGRKSIKFVRRKI